MERGKDMVEAAPGHCPAAKGLCAPGQSGRDQPVGCRARADGAATAAFFAATSGAGL